MFLSGAPVWLLWLAILLTAGGLALLVLKRHGLSGLTSPRRWAIWGLQSALAALLLALLWQPALRVSALKQQQNVVAVLVDDSKSMALKESGGTREEMA